MAPGAPENAARQNTRIMNSTPGENTSATDTARTSTDSPSAVLCLLLMRLTTNGTKKRPTARPRPHAMTMPLARSTSSPRAMPSCRKMGLMAKKPAVTNQYVRKMIQICVLMALLKPTCS